MICFKCGNQIPENSLFCNICGTKISNSLGKEINQASPNNGTFIDGNNGGLNLNSSNEAPFAPGNNLFQDNSFQLGNNKPYTFAGASSNYKFFGKKNKRAGKNESGFTARFWAIFVLIIAFAAAISYAIWKKADEVHSKYENVNDLVYDWIELIQKDPLAGFGYGELEIKQYGKEQFEQTIREEAQYILNRLYAGTNYNAYAVHYMNDMYTIVIDVYNDNNKCVGYVEGLFWRKNNKITLCEEMIYTRSWREKYRCSSCSGTGKGSKTVTTTCGICAGTGQQYVPNLNYDGANWQGGYIVCSGCAGSGKVTSALCSKCEGSGLKKP